jgi:hypothetical protein
VENGQSREIFERKNLLIQFARRSFQGFALEAYYYPAATSNKFMIQDTRGPNAHTTTTKDKMIELFTLQSHPKDLLNSSSSRKLPPSPLEQGIIEDNHINNKSCEGPGKIKELQSTFSCISSPPARGLSKHQNTVRVPFKIERNLPSLILFENNSKGIVVKRHVVVHLTNEIIRKLFLLGVQKAIPNSTSIFFVSLREVKVSQGFDSI